MARTRADKEGWQPKKKHNNSFEPEVVGKMELTEQDLQPIERLNFDEFARELSSLIDNPSKFKSTLFGWYHRFKLKRTSKAVDLAFEIAEKMRLASKSTGDLQERLIQDRIIFIHQAKLAIDRLNKDKEYEDIMHELRMEEAKAAIEKQRIIINTYKGVDPKDISPSERMVLLMQHVKSSSSTFATSDSHSSSHKEYTDIVEISKAESQEKWLQLYMKEREVELEKQLQEIRKTKTEADLAEKKTDKAIKEMDED